MYLKKETKGVWLSERYGTCRRCLGLRSCSVCGDTGLSGDAFDYLDPKYALRNLSQRVKGGLGALETACLAISDSFMITELKKKQEMEGSCT